MVAIHRLTACGVPDAEPLGQGGDGARLTSEWRLASALATGVLLQVAGTVRSSSLDPGHDRAGAR